MEQRCGYSGCPGSPKFSCHQDLNKVFCEVHISNHLSEVGLHQKIGLKELKKTSISSAAIKRLSDNSVLVSKVLLTGKDMFQQICDKLCQITDDLIERQNALSEIATNVTDFDSPLERIEKLGEISLKLRSKEEFAKLINQHFSKQDSTVDFTLFKTDIEGIVNSIKQSNECMEKIREESAKEKEERHRILNELKKVEESNVRIKKTLEDKINEVSIQTRAREKELASAGLVEAIQNKVQVIECQAMTSNRLVNQVIARCDLLEREIKSLNIMKKESEDNNLKFITEANEIIEVKLASLKIDYDDKIVDLDKNWAEREEALRREEERIKLDIEEKMNNEIKVLSDIKDKIIKEVNKTMVNIRNQIETTEKSCNGKVDDYILQLRENFNVELENMNNEIRLFTCAKDKIVDDFKNIETDIRNQAEKTQKDYNQKVDTEIIKTREILKVEIDKLKETENKILNNINETVAIIRKQIEEVQDNCNNKIDCGILKIRQDFDFEKDEVLEWIRRQLEEGENKKIVRFEEFKQIEDMRRKEEERKKKQEEDEIRRKEEEIKKKQEDDEIRRKEEERKKKQEEEEKAVRSIRYLVINLKKKIDYYHPIVLNQWRSLNLCHQVGKELLVSNDEKYLFFCKLY